MATGTVLVIEDDPALRETTRRILLDGGYRVLVAADAEEALAVVSDDASGVDAVVIDAVMPQKLGEAIVKRIQLVTPVVKVLYMSGYAQSVLTSLGTLTEGVTLVEKPFTEQALLAKIREVLDA